MDDGSETIAVPELKKFVTECFCAIGVCKSYSEIVADSLIGADITGHRSHGLFRLDKFIQDGHSGLLDVDAEPTIEKETSATAWVDGHNGLGAVVGTYCMKVAIQKAKEVGASIVVANNSNNFGVASFYSQQALKEGLIGFVFCNSSPLMLPNRAKYPITGTNPISLAAPALFGDFFLLDMATTIVSGGNIEMKYLNGEYIPIGWAVNAACLPETNPDVALKTGRFLPLGSYEELGSYKGTGLSTMIDILCGVLGGAHYSYRVGVWLARLHKQKANVGQCYIVIDPKRFAPDFQLRLSDFMSTFRDTEPLDPNHPIWVPGDRGKRMAKSIEENGGIWYPQYVIKIVKNMAQALKLKCVPFIPKQEPVQMTPSEELASRLAAENKIEEEKEVFAEDVYSVSGVSIHARAVSFTEEDSDDWLCPLHDMPHIDDSSLATQQLFPIYAPATENLDDKSYEGRTSIMKAGGSGQESEEIDGTEESNETFSGAFSFDQRPDNELYFYSRTKEG